VAINSTKKPLALPPSDKEAAAKAAPVIERVIGEDKSSATLIGVIRDSSKLTVAKLDTISKDLVGFRKDTAAFVKSLEPMVRYYQKKYQRYASLEEEYFKQAVKGIAKRAGVSDKFPESSSVYKAESTKAPKPGAPAVSLEDALNSFKTAYNDVMSAMKTVNNYAQAPIKLIDTALAAAIAVPLSMRRKKKAKVAAQKASVEKADAQNRRVEEESRRAAEAASDKINEANDYFERLEQVLRDVFQTEAEEAKADEEETGLVPYGEAEEAPTVTLLVDRMMVAAMVVGEVIFGSPMGPGDEAQDMRVVDDAEVTFMDATDSLADSVRAITENIPSQDLFQSAFGNSGGTSYEAQPEPMYYGSYRSLQITDGSEYGGATALSPGSGPGGPSGFFAGKEDAEDATFVKDQADDTLDAWESMLGPVLDFYSSPDQSAVGAFLSKLMGAAPGSGARADTLEIKLPPWVEKFANKLLGAMIPVLFAIAIGVVLIAAALAAFIVLLGVGVLVVLVAIGFAIAAIAAVLAFIGMVIGVFLFRVLMSIADGVEALIDAFVGFIRDPGAFIAKLAEGIGKAIRSIFGALTESIGKAFEDIPILKTISDTFDKLGASIASIIGSVAAVTKSIEGLISTFLEKLIPPIETISAIITAILAVLGTAILAVIVKVLATVNALDTWFRSGGLSLDKKERAEATRLAGVAYDNTVGAMVEVIRATSSMVDDKTKPVVDQIATSVGKVAGRSVADRATEDLKAGATGSGSSGATSVNNTVVQAMPGFYGIPIFGGGF